MNAVARIPSMRPRRPAQAAPQVPACFVVRQNDPERKANAVRALERWLTLTDVEVTLAPYRPKRSIQQHNLFWSWCELVAKHVREAGQPCCEDAVHDWILGAVYGAEDLGLGRSRPRRTLTRPHQMGKVECMEMLSRFEAEAAQEFGCVLPRPESWQADMAEARKEKPSGQGGLGE